MSPKIHYVKNDISQCGLCADDQFDRVRTERARYMDEVSGQIGENYETLLLQDLNADNLNAFLQLRLPERESPEQGDSVMLLSELQGIGIATLADVDRVLSRTEEAIIAYESKYPPTDPYDQEETVFSAVGVVRTALSFVNNEYRASRNSSVWEKKYEEFSHLIKGDQIVQGSGSDS